MRPSYSESESSDESLSQAYPEDEFQEFSKHGDICIDHINTSPADDDQRKPPGVSFFNKAKNFHISGGNFIGHADIHYHNVDGEP